VSEGLASKQTGRDRHESSRRSFSMIVTGIENGDRIIMYELYCPSAEYALEGI
jgi:hypothetical protein